MPRNKQILLCLAGLAVASAGLSACRGTTAAMSAQQADARFAWNLFERIAGDEGNAFFSPYSVASALGLTLLGARGRTEEQMQEVLFAGEADHERLGAVVRRLADEPVNDPTPDLGPPGGRPGDGDAFELNVANALWLQDGFALRAEYLAAAQEHYRAAPTTIDFRSDPAAARRRINDWVADRTRQRILDLLPAGAVKPQTRLALTNAVFFKSAWRKPFPEHATEALPFHLADGTTVPAPMMRQTDRFAYREIEGAQVLRLPYAGGQAAMVVILPDADAGLASLERSLTHETLTALIAGEDAAIRRVAVTLPRFRIERSVDLAPPLAALGMPSAFAAGTADFSGLTGARDLFIDAAVHKAFVEVDEQGTEAAAATAVTMALTSMPGPQDEPIVFRADRPFLFGIVDEPSGTLLFLGRLADPRRD